jgi:hypothetical protein
VLIEKDFEKFGVIVKYHIALVIEAKRDFNEDRRYQKRRYERKGDCEFRLTSFLLSDKKKKI